MTETANQPLPPTYRPAFHTATVMAREHRPITFAELFHAIKRIAPEARVGTWEGHVSMPPAVDPGVEMLLLDGERLAVFVVNGPTPAVQFDIGSLVSIHMRDPAAVCRGHRGHIRVMRTEKPTTRGQALARSRAVTLVACAVAMIVPAVAIQWADADHVVPPELAYGDLPKIAPPGGVAPSLWARLLIHAGPPTKAGAQTLIVGTVGLHAFGIRDIEYAPTTSPPNEALGHAAAVAEYLLQSGAELKDGETLGTPGDGGFAISWEPRGHLLGAPICLLTPLL